jgi:hypothetical protein
MPRGYPALNEVQKKEIIRRVTDGDEIRLFGNSA